MAEAEVEDVVADEPEAQEEEQEQVNEWMTDKLIHIDKSGSQYMIKFFSDVKS